MTEIELGWEEENFKNAYVNWIEREMRAGDYHILFDVLYDTEFTWDRQRVPMDSNREADGRYLRRRFSDASGLVEPFGCVEWPASFLEVMVALAFRIHEQLMYDPVEHPEDGPWMWFWEWMGNAGLDTHTDDEMMRGGQGSFMMTTARVNAIMDRRYSYSGEGGFFPLEDARCDQRNEEMWFQANSYMGERYFGM